LRYNWRYSVTDPKGLQTVYGPNHGHTYFADGCVRSTNNMDARVLQEILNPPQEKPDIDGCYGRSHCSHVPITPIYPPSRPKSNVQKCCRNTRVCFCIDTVTVCLNLKHCWLKTSTVAGGMGPIGDGRLPMSPWYGTETEVKDHSSESSVDCQTILGCDEDCVNKAIAPGIPTGTWSPSNNCNSFIDGVLAKCCGHTGR
jgi:hypothetical protein